MNDSELEFTEVSRTRGYDGYRKIDHVMFRDPRGIEHTYDIRVGGDSIAVVAITPDQQVVLARQYRHGAGRIMLELPGGGIEPGEDPLAAGMRELLEETGYAGEGAYVGAQWQSGYANYQGHVAVVTNATPVAELSLDDAEFIEVVLMPLAEFREHIRTGEFTDAGKAYRDLDHLGLL